MLFAAARRVVAHSHLARLSTAAAASAVATGVSASFCLAAEKNPLLSTSFFPQYNEVKPEHVGPAMEVRLAQAMAKLSALEANVQATLSAGKTPTYRELADDAERLAELVTGPWGVVSHLKSVKDSDALREAHAAAQSKVTEFYTRLGQSAPLYKGWRALKDDASAWNCLSDAERRVADLEIRGAELQGIGLEGAAKERFNGITQELAKLKTSFGNNVLDGTKAFSHKLVDKKSVAGLPSSALAMMAASSKRKGDADATAEAGPWTATLDGPSLLAVLRHADDATLREKVYRAYVSRASDLGDGGDNAGTIEKILALRNEQARLLSYASYAELSIAKKMATLSGARELLEDLRSRAFEPAKAEHAELEKFAGKVLAHWDVAYYAEKLKKERYAFDEEETRPYLQLDAVLAGLFGVCARLFDVEIAQIQPASVGAQVWDEGVRLFEVRRDTIPVGYFFLDPFARPAEKKGGAWMNGVINRSRAMAPPDAGYGAVRLPVAILVCNQGEPTVDAKTGQVTPSLMTFGECTTLFHECGHGLQHMLTNVAEGAVSGISGVEWDAVEQPSQFMEYWVLEQSTLSSMAKHWQTGETIPAELVSKIRAAKNFRAASAMLRQVQFASVDLNLHDATFSHKPGAALDVYRETAKKTAVRPPLPEDRFLNAFSHIFAGGYAAGCEHRPSHPNPRTSVYPSSCIVSLRAHVYCVCVLFYRLFVQVGRSALCGRLCRLRGGWPRQQPRGQVARPALCRDCAWAWRLQVGR
jgi:oligopeptidase A